jgi:hypothetical protein
LFGENEDFNEMFRETNSYFNHGDPDVSDAGGAALWLTDYALFGATLGIKRMYFHEGVGYKYSLASHSHYLPPPSTSLSTTPIILRFNPFHYLVHLMMDILSTFQHTYKLRIMEL